MSFVQRFDVALACNGSGGCTAFTPAITGKIKSVQFVKPGSNGITNATFAVTAEATGEPILSVSAISASTVWYPRAPTHDTTGAAALYAAAGTHVGDTIALAEDRVEIVVSGGGANAVGTMLIVVE